MALYGEFYPSFAGGVTVAGASLRSRLEAIAFPEESRENHTIIIEKQHDHASPTLMQQCAKGRFIRSPTPPPGGAADFAVRLDVTRGASSAPQVTDLSVILRGGRLVRDDGPARLSPGTGAVERFLLSFAKMTYTNMPATRARRDRCGSRDGLQMGLAGETAEDRPGAGRRVRPNLGLE